MPILPLVDQKHLNADSIISPVVEIPESRKLSLTPHRSPIDNRSRYHPSSTLAPGMDPQVAYQQDTKPDMAANIMHTYPPPQMVPYQNPQAAVSNGYIAYAAANSGHHMNQTYPAPQVARKPVNGFANGLQIPNTSYHPSSVHNNLDQYSVGPVSTVQQQQAMYTDSPVDTTAFPPYNFSQPAQHPSSNMTATGYDTSGGTHYQQPATYTAMQYLTAQHNYNYQG